MKSLALICGFSLLAAGALSAQETPKFSFDIGGGFTQPVGSTGMQLNDGWNVQGGAGYNFSPHLGAMLQVNYNAMGINSSTLNTLGFPGGDVHVLSATVEPIIHLHPKGRIDPYIVGGGGLYHIYDEFTQPTVATITGFSPFFGFFPAQVAATQVLSSYSINKPGFNVGAGISIGTKYKGKFFAEARWDHIFMSNYGHMDYVPVSFGFRW